MEKSDVMYYTAYILLMILLGIWLLLWAIGMVELTEMFLERWRSLGVPSIEEMTRVETRMADDAYSLLFSLRATGSANEAPTATIDVMSMSHLSVEFTVDAADPDGQIARVCWDFGDGDSSWSASTWHTYDAPGEYLVSCTVIDNDGVNVTDWRYIKVPKGNADGDGDIDLKDYAEFTRCLTGQGQDVFGHECQVFDFDCDGDVDLSDVMDFQIVFTGSRP